MDYEYHKYIVSVLMEAYTKAYIETVDGNSLQDADSIQSNVTNNNNKMDRSQPGEAYLEEDVNFTKNKIPAKDTVHNNESCCTQCCIL